MKKISKTLLILALVLFILGSFITCNALTKIAGDYTIAGIFNDEFEEIFPLEIEIKTPKKYKFIDINSKLFNIKIKMNDRDENTDEW